MPAGHPRRRPIPELDKRNTLGLNALRILDRQPWFRGGLLRRTR